jgi:hypothetical protein
VSNVNIPVALNLKVKSRELRGDGNPTMTPIVMVRSFKSSKCSPFSQRRSMPPKGKGASKPKEGEGE